jgi:glycosyltransferase involved in cell wall biosynthesis
VTRTASVYQEFICQSKAEFAVAKQGYESSRSGWFSERSAAYLACGRPVVTQNTGFSDWLTADGGVLPFDSPQSATDAIDRVSRDYATHCRLARRVAEDFFESGAVLSELLRQATGAVFRAGRI